MSDADGQRLAWLGLSSQSRTLLVLTALAFGLLLAGLVVSPFVLDALTLPLVWKTLLIFGLVSGERGIAAFAATAFVSVLLAGSPILLGYELSTLGVFAWLISVSFAVLRFGWSGLVTLVAGAPYMVIALFAAECSARHNC